MLSASVHNHSFSGCEPWIAARIHHPGDMRDASSEWWRKILLHGIGLVNKIEKASWNTIFMVVQCLQSYFLVLLSSRRHLFDFKLHTFVVMIHTFFSPRTRMLPAFSLLFSPKMSDFSANNSSVQKHPQFSWAPMQLPCFLHRQLKGNEFGPRDSPGKNKLPRIS